MNEESLFIYKAFLEGRLATMENIAEERVSAALNILTKAGVSGYNIALAISTLTEAHRAMQKSYAFREAIGELEIAVMGLHDIEN